jgi:antitoxin component YwqK of YwqJK toxin-antitoxin module
MLKIFKWILLIAVLGGAGWVTFKWYQTRDFSVEAFSLIPSDAIYCVTTDDPIATWKAVSASGQWTHLQKNAYFAALTASANNLDSMISENNFLFDMIGSRALVVSAHMTTPKAYDFLFLVDLKEASGIKFLNEYLSAFTAQGFSIRKEKYVDDDLIILYNSATGKSLHLSVPGSYLLASYSKKIITSALDAKTGKNLLSEEVFVKRGEETEGDGMLRFYINYAQLPEFMNSYSSGPNEYVNRLSQAMQKSVLTMNIEDGMIRATGNTYVNDSIESYLKTLAVSGEAPTEFMEIVPQRTGFCLGLGFKSFQEFFGNFERNLQQDVAEYNDYRNNLKQAENYLNIDLQKNLISWIGDEIALLELQSSGKGLDNETALILKADNIEKARQELAHIEKMVRKKTPVKFKSIDHQGYTINYLSMKGMFQMLLGKFFARYDKPYYTIINNFVVFSNHPQTLQSIIDDYLGKQTLDRSENFRTFRKEFEDEGSVFVYLNTPVLFNTMKKLADNQTRTSMEDNKQYIVCFRQIGFQLVPDEGGFKTVFAEQFEEPEPAPLVASMTTPGDLKQPENDPVETEVRMEESDPMALPYIYVKNLSASSHEGFFPDSTLQFEVSLKNGFKDGPFTEYYPDGDVKMKGHFKNDKRDGTWRLFDDEGKLILKRNYENGEMTKEKEKD